LFHIVIHENVPFLSLHQADVGLKLQQPAHTKNQKFCLSNRVAQKVSLSIIIAIMKCQDKNVKTIYKRPIRVRIAGAR